MFNILREFLSEDNGGLSTMRMAVMLIIVAFLFNWTYLTVHTGQAIPFDWEDIALLLGAMGIKAFQKDKEEKVKREGEQ